jgi:uncharacterized repeat protein (TIGR03803 family)
MKRGENPELSKVTCIRHAAYLGVALIAASAHAASGPTLVTLFDFLPPNGSEPTGALASDAAGNLYGFTESGGVGGRGVAYELVAPTTGTAAWAGKVLANLGVQPGGGPLRGSDGSLYGVGNTFSGTDQGTVYRIKPPVKGATAWTKTTIYTFGGGADGARPTGGLIGDTAGNLYGVTQTGGSAGHGTVYRLAPPASGVTTWTKTILYNFAGAPDGNNPWDSLAAGSDGALFGVTLFGGTACTPEGGCGTVYKLTPPGSGHTAWTEEVIASLHRAGDDTHGLTCGSQPNAVVVAPNGVLYGTTGGGCGGSGDDGSVYELVPPAPGKNAWVLSTLHSFTDTPDGSAPFCALTLAADGTLYGTAAGGGGSGDGTVFKITHPKGLPWTEPSFFLSAARTATTRSGRC